MEYLFPLDDCLPVIRKPVAAGSAPGDGLDDVVALYADRFILFTTKRKNDLDDACFEPGGEQALRRTKPVGGVIDLAWEEMAGVECSPRFFYGRRLNGSREEGRELRLHTLRRGTTRIFLPEDDAVLVRQALSQLLPGRYAEDVVFPKYTFGRMPDRRKECSPSSRRTGWLVVLLFVFLLAGIAKFLLHHRDDETGFLSYVAPVCFSLVGISMLLLLFHLAIAGTRAVGYESHFKKERKLAKLRSKRAKRDLSGRKALRSRPLGWLLKSIGCVIVLLGLGASSLIGLVTVSKDVPGNVGSIVQTLFFLVAVVFIYYGYLLSQRPAERALKDDLRPPILFLRPFEIDGRTDLNPPGMLAQILGLQTFGWLRKLGPFGNVHPLRLARLVFSATADHSEEQMARYFRRYGPFVAIGKPGERFSLGGAARFYVTDDRWQGAVLDLLARAQFVVLQPSSTPGVRWEIAQTVKLVAPERILLCLTWFAGSQARYDEFRLRLAQDTPLRLPRSLGHGNFACFDPSGQGGLLPMRLRTPLVWPLSGCAVNFKEMLHPFFSRLKGEPTAIPPRPNKLWWFLQGTMACLLWFSLLAVVNIGATVVTAAAYNHVGQSYDASAALSALVKDPEHRLVESGPGWTWTLPLAWHRDPKSEPDPQVRLYQLGEGAAVMSRVITIAPLDHFQREIDSSDWLDAIIAETKEKVVFRSAVSKQQIAVHGQNCSQAEYDVEVSGLDLHYVMRTIIRPRIRVLLVGWAAKDQFEQFRPSIADAMDHLNLNE